MTDRSPEVDAYIAAQPAEKCETLEAVRALIHETVPGVTEDIRYKMPAFLTTDVVCTLAAQKSYFGLYICDPELLDKHREALAGLNLGKGCIRFKSLDDVPVAALKAVLLDAAINPGWAH
ncbi:MAG: DUF1801 domain-containing protein [Pseudomonadota bacterium]